MRSFLMTCVGIVTLGSCATGLTFEEYSRVLVGDAEPLAYVAPARSGTYVSERGGIVLVTRDGSVRSSGIELSPGHVVFSMDVRDAKLLYVSGNPGFFGELFLFDQASGRSQNLTGMISPGELLPTIRFARWVGDDRFAVELIRGEAGVRELRVYALGESAFEIVLEGVGLTTHSVRDGGDQAIASMRSGKGGVSSYWISGSSRWEIPSVLFIAGADFISGSEAVAIGPDGLLTLTRMEGRIDLESVQVTDDRILDVRSIEGEGLIVTLQSSNAGTWLVTYRILGM